jgi:fused signal recognition particle receptor
MSFWDKLQKGLRRTREQVGQALAAVLQRGGAPDSGTRTRLEEALLLADVGPATTERLIGLAEERMRKSPDLDLRHALEQTAAEMLAVPGPPLEPAREGAGAAPKPWVLLLVGVNGSGKTTLAGKLAAHFARQGHRALLVAADTFRAAAPEQLEVWAARAGVEMVSARAGSDPAAVVHDGLETAKSRGADVVLVDTAGRLHTRHNLMAELEKVGRVCARLVPGAPHHVLLVLDATIGQNSLSQAREFQRAIAVTSLAVNKLDGTARGGAVLAIADQLRLPIRALGTGEDIDDWVSFEPQAFARALFE